MKPFNLERALAGDPVETRSGIKGIRVTKLPIPFPSGEQIFAQKEDGSSFGVFFINGKRWSGIDDPKDLIMPPVKQVKWGNVYSDGSIPSLHNTEEEARRAANVSASLGGKINATAVRIEYEED